MARFNNFKDLHAIIKLKGDNYILPDNSRHSEEQEIMTQDTERDIVRNSTKEIEDQLANIRAKTKILKQDVDNAVAQVRMNMVVAVILSVAAFRVGLAV